MSDDTLTNLRMKVFRLRGLAALFESDPGTQADFAQLGLDVSWCRRQASRARDLADLMERSGSVH